MSYLKYSFLLANDHFRPRNPFCSSGPVRPPRPCCAGPGAALRGDVPIAPPSPGTSGSRGEQAASPASQHIQAAPRAGCNLVQLTAATRCPLSFASGHNVWSRTGGKRPKEEENLPLPPSQQSTPSAAPACSRAQLWEARLRLSSSRQTHGFTCALLFQDQILENKPLPPQCRAGACGSMAAGCLSPFACPWQPSSPPTPRDTLSAPLPRWGFNPRPCGFFHPHPEPAPIAPG